MLTWEAVLTLGTIVGMLAALIRGIARPDLIFLTALACLMVAGVISPETAFSGFANGAIWVIGSLFVVAAAIQRTDLLAAADRIFFARSNRPQMCLLQLSASTAAISAFTNNTPIVAMLTPRIQEWCKMRGFSASRFLIPLSYATIAGGMTTMVGTSTNVVVSSLVTGEGHASLGFFTFAWVGLPVAIALILFVSFVGYKLLPGRVPAQSNGTNGIAEYVYELRVPARSGAVGRSIAEAGLRSLGGAYLIHIRRGGRVVEASPDEVIQQGDILAFVGDVTTLESLLHQGGLETTLPALDETAPHAFPLYEAVVADTSTMVGKSLKDVHFRETYGGVVLAIHRHGQRITHPIGRIPIREGDLLLLEARNGFEHRWKMRRDEFYLVAPHGRTLNRPAADKAPIALTILAIMVLAIIFKVASLTIAAFAAALAMIGTGCVSTHEARRAVNVQVLIIIAAALGIGQALQDTGITAAIADFIITAARPFGAIGIIAALYVSTNVLTEMVTNSAAAAIMVTIAISTALDAGFPVEAAAVTVAIAASASFMTPIGYQTNLMVMSPGRYAFTDYVKAGLPVSVIVMTVSMAMIYLVWL